MLVRVERWALGLRRYRALEVRGRASEVLHDNTNTMDLARSPARDRALWAQWAGQRRAAVVHLLAPRGALAPVPPGPSSGRCPGTAPPAALGGGGGARPARDGHHGMRKLVARGGVGGGG